MTTRLSAFVGRSFLDDDRGVWHELRDILDSLKSMGFEYEDGREGQLRPISEKVKEIIMRHEIYIGVLTKRFPVWFPPSSWHERWLYRRGSYVPQKWTTSEWVIEEIGFAIGKERKILLLIEDGVHFPTTDLDGDTQWILFKRDNMAASQSEISEMILNLISQRVTTIAEPVSVATHAAGGGGEKDNQPPSILSQMKAINEQVLKGNFTEADRIQDEIIKAQTEEDARSFFESFLLSIRARKNDISALSRLKQRCSDNPSDHNAITFLSEVYSSFGQFDEAVKLLCSHLDIVPSEKRNELAIKAAKALCQDGETSQAVSLLLGSLQNESNETTRNSLYRELARVAQNAKDTDLESAFLEMYIKVTPTDNDARFRLAYVYSDNDQAELAAYHYEQVVAHTSWPGASNNLAVTYQQLGLKANQHLLFKNVADQYALAKSNLADIYASAGALSEAEDLAKSVLSVSENNDDIQIAQDRARYVLGEIETTKKTEREAIDRIAGDTKDVREFMCAYAEAYCLPSLAKDKGVFATAHGDVEIVRESSYLQGEGLITKTAPRGLLNSFVAMPAGLSATEPKISTYLLSLSAQLHGRSGTFELTISPREKPRTILGDSTRTIKGLMCFTGDGNVIQFLERSEKKPRVVSAQRKL